MLTHLSIQNYTIAEHLELELHPGMTVITGETGAGKSISMDALGLTLGSRADSKAVRHGADRADIYATFDITTLPLAIQWLQDHDVVCHEGECILRRVITKEGRSRAYVNSQPVTLNDLKTLGQMLIDIHGQHEHQSLLKKTTHRQLLDAFAKHLPLSKEIEQLFQDWSSSNLQLQNLKKNTAESQAQAQLLAYQVDELNQLAMQVGELEQLENEQKNLANAEQIITASQSALTICEGNNAPGTLDLVHQARSFISDLKDSNQSLQEADQLFETSQIYLEEARQTLQHHIDNFDGDPQRLQQVEQRLSEIFDIARKHKIEPRQLLATQDRLQGELNKLNGSDAQIEELQAQLDMLETHYQKLATKLSKQRHKAAKALIKAMTEQLRKLELGNCQFDIQLSTHHTAGTIEDSKPHPNGLESIEFLISSNISNKKSQPAQPLAKIASGGELSRISLAIQVVTARTSDTPTLVFDEVDVGIGGSTAEVVGNLLRQLGESNQVQGQVICITHQPQVAAKGHHHLRVSKRSDGDAIVTEVASLNNTCKINEIARMLGGIEVTERTVAHAREMLALEEEV